MLFKCTVKNLRVGSFDPDKVKDISDLGLEAITCSGSVWTITKVIVMHSGRKYGLAQGDIDQIYINGSAYSSIELVDLSNVIFK